MDRYVALLRGINVGGKNLIRMPDLKRCFEEMGFADVVTYIQSGNVIFAAGDAAGDRAGLVQRIEAGLAERFRYDASVVLRTRDELRAVVESAPPGFGSDPELRRYDVLFLKEPLTATEAFAVLPRRDGVDEAAPGPGVVYYSRLIGRASQSRLSRVTSMPIYASMTIRNWNTTTRLLEMLDAV